MLSSAGPSLFQLVPASPSRFYPVPAGPSQFQLVPAGPSQFQPVPASPSWFQAVPAGSSWYQSLPASSSQFQPVPAGPSQFQPIPASSSQFQPALPGTAEPLREAGGTSGKAYIRNRKRLPGSERKYMRNNSVTAGEGVGERLRGQLAKRNQRNSAIFDGELLLCFIFLTVVAFKNSEEKRKGNNLLMYIFRTTIHFQQQTVAQFHHSNEKETNTFLM